MKQFLQRFGSILFGAILFVPLFASAHEVYVLDPEVVGAQSALPAFDMWSVAMQDLHRFIFWALIGFIVVSTIFFVSIFRVFETALYPFFRALRPYAPAVARITVGIGLIAGSYFGATFGPELPTAETFGGFAPLVSLTFTILGVLIVIGFWARAAALVAAALFAVIVSVHGAYSLTYANYLGEILVLLILGSHRISVHSFTGWSERFHRAYHVLARKLEPLAFPILRISFGISLLYASFYAKILHNNLALQVASFPMAGHEYSLAHYFGFEPHFLVLGAAIVEVVLGCFFILGLEIRWTCIFLEFWLALSLWYFGESVWPHIVLVGIPIALFMHGYDKYSLEGRYFKRRNFEPIL